MNGISIFKEHTDEILKKVLACHSRRRGRRLSRYQKQDDNYREPHSIPGLYRRLNVASTAEGK